MTDRPTFNLRDLRRRADDAAARFDSADFLHAVTRDGLFERMRPLVIEPACVLDLGAATGAAAAPLRKRFGKTHLVSLDISRNMLRQARRKRGWLSRQRAAFVQAEATRLPFRDSSIDMVFSNMMLPFSDRPGRVFEEVARVLREGGLFAFSTLGPDSFLEIRRAWSRVDREIHVNSFPDMHDIGDALVRAGLRDPVLDVDRLAIKYEDSDRLFADLGNAAARNTLEQRSRSLMGKQRFGRLKEALSSASADAGIHLDMELVYGHCWGGGPLRDPANYTIDAARIPRRRG